MSGRSGGRGEQHCVLGRAALALIGLWCTCCAANLELRRASELGAKQLDCAAGAAETNLEEDDGTRRVYTVECEMIVVRVVCSDAAPCEVQVQPRPGPPIIHQML